MNHYDDIKQALGVDQAYNLPPQIVPDALSGPRLKKRAPGGISTRESPKEPRIPGKRIEKDTLVMGVDPGPTESAYALIQPDYTIVRAAKVPNRLLNIEDRYSDSLDGLIHVAIEGLACYGRPVGRETFETAYMVGRCCERADLAGIPYTIYARPVYANAIAGCGKVTDAILRQALLLRFGGDRKGEPLHALKGSSDLRSAFAIAAYWLDNQMLERKQERGRSTSRPLP